MWNLKRNNTNELYKVTKQKETHREQIYGFWGEGIVREFWMDMYTVLYLKCITNKDLLYSTWNSGQYYVTVQMEGGFRGEWIHVYVWLNPFIIHLKLSQRC